MRAFYELPSRHPSDAALLQFPAVHASIFVILALMLALDLAWWRYADGLLRPLRRARLWRGMLAAYMALQVFLLAWSISARLVGPGFDQLTPKTLIAGTYLWHLVALPPEIHV